jgi:hypothetical protein
VSPGGRTSVRSSGRLARSAAGPRLSWARSRACPVRRSPCRVGQRRHDRDACQDRGRSRAHHRPEGSLSTEMISDSGGSMRWATPGLTSTAVGECRGHSHPRNALLTRLGDIPICRDLRSARLPVQANGVSGLGTGDCTTAPVATFVRGLPGPLPDSGFVCAQAAASDAGDGGFLEISYAYAAPIPELGTNAKPELR